MQWLTLLLSLSTAVSAVKYGCWSDRSSKFDEDCLVAYTGLVAENMRRSATYAFFPNYVQSAWHGDCRVNIRGSNRWFPVVDLLNQIDMLVARCQNGFFYYEDGSLDSSSQGHATPKRSIDEHAVGDDIFFDYSSSMYNWTSTDFDRTSLEHITGSLQKRVPPGPMIANDGSAGLGALQLFRSVQGSYRLDRITLTPLEYVLQSAHLLDGARNNLGNAAQRRGFGIVTEYATSLAMVMILGKLHNSWSDMFSASDDTEYAISRLLATASQDFVNNRFAGSVYHIINAQGDFVVSFVLNAVYGVPDPLP